MFVRRMKTFIESLSLGSGAVLVALLSVGAVWLWHALASGLDDVVTSKGRCGSRAPPEAPTRAISWPRRARSPDFTRKLPGCRWMQYANRPPPRSSVIVFPATISNEIATAGRNDAPCLGMLSGRPSL